MGAIATVIGLAAAFSFVFIIPYVLFSEEDEDGKP